MRASLQKTSTVCKPDVLSVRILRTRRLPSGQVIQQKTRATRYVTSAQMHAANATDATSLECLS